MSFAFNFPFFYDVADVKLLLIYGRRANRYAFNVSIIDNALKA